MLKNTVRNKHLKGMFQEKLVATLHHGKHKMRNMCLWGATDMAKSYLLKPLTKIFW